MRSFVVVGGLKSEELEEISYMKYMISQLRKISMTTQVPRSDYRSNCSPPS